MKLQRSKINITSQWSQCVCVCVCYIFSILFNFCAGFCSAMPLLLTLRVHAQTHAVDIRDFVCFSSYFFLFYLAIACLWTQSSCRKIHGETFFLDCLWSFNTLALLEFVCDVFVLCKYTFRTLFWCFRFSIVNFWLSLYFIFLRFSAIFIHSARFRVHFSFGISGISDLDAEKLFGFYAHSKNLKKKKTPPMNWIAL